MLTLTVDTSEGRRKFGLLTDSWRDLTPVLKEFDKFKRGKIDEIFSSQGRGEWPERSERSEERGWIRAFAAAKRAPSTMLKKLRREMHRAERRDKGVRTVHLIGGGSYQVRGKSNAVARRAFVLRAYEEMVAGGQLDTATFTDPDRRLQKSVRGLQKRIDRATARAGRQGQVLGALARTIQSKIDRGTLTIDSSWDSPAPLVLQEGGKVGNDAEVPPRPYLYWEPSDVEYLALLLKERSLLAWRS